MFQGWYTHVTLVHGHFSGFDPISLLFCDQIIFKLLNDFSPMIAWAN